MKKILGLTIAALLVMGLVGGGTWALFSDVETVDTSTLASGTLDLGLDTVQGGNSNDGITAQFTATDWAPGETQTATIYVYNGGTIDISTLEITFAEGSVVDGTAALNVSPIPGGATDDLLLQITTTDVKFGTVASPTDVVALESKTLTELGALSPYDLGPLAAGEELELFIEFTFSSNATNGCQGDTVDLDIDFTGSQ